VVDNGEGRAPRQQPGPASTFTATNGPLMVPDQGDGHCPRCSCRCRCHRPSSEPPYIVVPPRPGEPFYSAYLAELRVA
jgi:hypothetical protein